MKKNQDSGDYGDDINKLIRKAVNKKAQRKKKEEAKAKPRKKPEKAIRKHSQRKKKEKAKAKPRKKAVKARKHTGKKTKRTRKAGKGLIRKSSEQSSNLKKYLSLVQEAKKEISKVVVGQEEVVNGILRALIANGHVLVEGVPGIAKSLIVKAIAVITGCNFGRVQFTVDLLPTDIIGVTALSSDRSSFEVLKGPIFNNFVMADEINRAPPKTQSALLEAMAERQVTISRQTYSLEMPFFVMATQNPIETAGTYVLPEAQTDRFLFKLVMTYPGKEHESRIIEQNISLKSFESFELKKIMTPEDIIEMQKVVNEIKHTPRINNYIVEIVNATREPRQYGLNLGKYISLGASPRASIFIFIAGKADAFMNGQVHVTPQNIKNIAADVLRHRISLNYRAQIDNITQDDVIKEILSKVKIP